MSRLLFHECLGRGGYGEVYRCTWSRRELELEVAVKVLNASVGKGSQAQKRLKDEARLLGALTHPGILRVYDLAELRGNVAMIAEYVDGADLDRCVLDGLPAKALLETVSRVSSALAAAWGDISPVSGKPLRLVHRDVKPENIRITSNGEVKLLDFGVARAAELRRESETATNTVLGSYRYMAPERFDTGLEPHPSVDVFALGCILYEGLAFRRLFEHLSMREMLVLSLPGTDRYETFIDERMAELPDSTDPSTVQLIRRLVSRDPAHRPMPGRLAALCDDEADRAEGQGLGPWCRSREWPRLTQGNGEWSGQEYEVTDANSGTNDIGSIYLDVSGDDGESTGDITFTSLEMDAREVLGEPGFAPSDLGFGDDVVAPDQETDPDFVPVFEDEPTVGTIRPPPPPPPPVASSTRDPAPPRIGRPFPKPSPAPPATPARPTFDPDATLQQPRAQLLGDEGPEPVVPPSAPKPPPEPQPDPVSLVDEAGPPADAPTDVPAPPPPVGGAPPEDPGPVDDPDEGALNAALPRDLRREELRDDASLPPATDPDRTATETVDLYALRARIEAEKKRFDERRATKRLEEDTSTADVPPVSPLRADAIPDDLFDVPIADSDAGSGDDATPVQVPRTPQSAPPARTGGKRRPKPGAVSAPVIWNVAVLGILLALGALALLGWILFS
ncbi:MAG: serine/threonine-protein kinase [Myxococcota bacterium]